MTQTAVFTIADRRFLPALAGLVNSIRAVTADVPIVVGTPDPLPELEGVTGLRTVLITGEPLWTGFLKAALLLREAGQDFVFLDADIVVADPSFLGRLQSVVERGPVLALEGLVAPNDYRRVRWAARLARPQARADAWGHYNGGFLAGRLPRDRPFLEAWHEGMCRVLAGVSGYMKDEDFPFGDQDVLNAIVQSSGDPFTSLQFPDWWSAAAPLNPFLHVGAFPAPALYHCTGDKPWNLTMVPARAPTAYELLWFRHAVLQAEPLHVPIDLPAEVGGWLSGSWSGRLASRGARLKRRLKDL